MAPSEFWLFGYGSLIWRPDFAFQEQRRARLHGWVRRFWQGSHDHRGLPHAPGRVVTLVEEPDGVCDGMAYLLACEDVDQIIDYLDHREKNGYVRRRVALTFPNGGRASGWTYVAAFDNHAFLGPAPNADIIAQIRNAAGPSGTNADYLLELAQGLRRLKIEDAHVFELEAWLLRSQPE